MEFKIIVVNNFCVSHMIRRSSNQLKLTNLQWNRSSSKRLNVSKLLIKLISLSKNLIAPTIYPSLLSLTKIILTDFTKIAYVYWNKMLGGNLEHDHSIFLHCIMLFQNMYGIYKFLILLFISSSLPFINILRIKAKFISLSVVRISLFVFY